MSLEVQPNSWLCSRCNASNSDTAALCVYCGTAKVAPADPNVAPASPSYSQGVSYSAGTTSLLPPTGYSSPYTGTAYAIPPMAPMAPNADPSGAAPGGNIVPPGGVFSPYVSDLPPYWERRYDQWGREYFTNHQTKTTQWENPNFTQPANTGGIPGFFRQLSSPSYQKPGAVYEHDMQLQQQQQQQQQAAPSAYGYAPSGPNNPGAGLNQLSLDVVPEGKEKQDNQQFGRDDEKGGISQAQAVLDRGEPSCLSIICTTMANNKLLTILSIPTWTFLGLFLQSYQDNSRSGTLWLPLCLSFYGMYFLMFVCNAGLFPYVFEEPCTDCCLGDRLQEYMNEASVEPQETQPIMEEMVAAKPQITLHVVCSHQKSTGSGKKRRTKTVVTFRGSFKVDASNIRDVSVSPAAFVESINYCEAQCSFVDYRFKYELLPKDQELLVALKRQYYEKNRHRDTTCNVSEVYEISGFSNKKISSVVKRGARGSCRYRLAQLLVNKGAFFLAIYASLYLPYLWLWKKLVR